MISYQYRVRDPMGNTHQGSLTAASREDAIQQLRRDGFRVLQLDEEDDGQSLLGGRITRSDLAYATSQLAVMVDTGIPLAEALNGMIQQERKPALKRVLADLKHSVEAGEDFSTALAHHPKLFDQTYVALVRASEASGSLGPMLERLAQYLRKELQTRARVRSAMAYPTVMLLLAIAVTLFLLTYILPKFTPLFQAKGTQLPAMTRFVMGLSDVLIGYWYIWLSVVVAAVAGVLLARRLPAGRRWIDRLKIDMPVLGPMFRKVIISRSIRTLGTMLQSGVPTLDAIRLCAQAAGNVHYQALWEEVRSQVAAGEPIASVLGQNPLFPHVLVQMIAAGEQAGRLGQVLQRVSNHYDQEVDTAIRTATGLLEPLMIGLMGVVVGTIGLALLLPIFSLSRHP